jgi:hypothetical protein
MSRTRGVRVNSRGESIAAVLEELKERGTIKAKNIAEVLGIPLRRALARAHKWCELGWLKLVERGVFAPGWKANGRRDEPAPGTDEAAVLNFALRFGRVTLVEAAVVVASKDAEREYNLNKARRVVKHLVDGRWLRGAGNGYNVAPDPFLTDDQKARVANAIAKLRSGNLLLEKIVRA